MSTAIQAFKDKMSFSVTHTTFETFHLSLKKSTVNQNLVSLHQDGMSFVDRSLRALENNFITVAPVPLLNSEQQH